MPLWGNSPSGPRPVQEKKRFDEQADPLCGSACSCVRGSGESVRQRPVVPPSLRRSPAIEEPGPRITTAVKGRGGRRICRCFSFTVSRCGALSISVTSVPLARYALPRWSLRASPFYRRGGFNIRPLLPPFLKKPSPLKEDGDWGSGGVDEGGPVSDPPRSKCPPKKISLLLLTTILVNAIL